MGKSGIRISMFNLRCYKPILMKSGIMKLMSGNWPNTASIFHGHEAEYNQFSKNNDSSSLSGTVFYTVRI
jgi:hypothetical protein